MSGERLQDHWSSGCVISLKYVIMKFLRKLQNYPSRISLLLVETGPRLYIFAQVE